MATGTAGGVGRRYHANRSYLTANITVSDEDDSISMGWLPAGAIVTATAWRCSPRSTTRAATTSGRAQRRRRRFAASVDVSNVGVKLPHGNRDGSEVLGRYRFSRCTRAPARPTPLRQALRRSSSNSSSRDHVEGRDTPPS